ncbi:MAG TPA: hypothetical protein IAD45_06920 [Candidatus Faecimonas intestinavium]|nr:hypothetical protein [Candidatus Faecimonas intestinavium]
MKIIDELKNKISNENKRIVLELSNIIIDNKITTLEELKQKEDEIFTYNGKVLNEDERIDFCLEMIKYSSADYELLSFNEIQEYKRLKLELKSYISNDEKIKDLIILFSMTDRDMMFLTEAYDLIVSNKL